MPEIMVRFDDLRRYCEKRHCGSVPLEYIKQMQTIEAEPIRHGRWIDWSMCGKSLYQCSECNAEMKYKTNFCPRCGAKMQTEPPEIEGGAENG